MIKLVVTSHFYIKDYGASLILTEKYRVLSHFVMKKKVKKRL